MVADRLDVLARPRSRSRQPPARVEPVTGTRPAVRCTLNNREVLAWDGRGWDIESVVVVCNACKRYFLSHLSAGNDDLVVARVLLLEDMRTNLTCKMLSDVAQHAKRRIHPTTCVVGMKSLLNYHSIQTRGNKRSDKK